MWLGPMVKERHWICQSTYEWLITRDRDFPNPLLFLGTFTHFPFHLYFIKLNFLWVDSNLMAKGRRDRLRNTMLLPELWGSCRMSPQDPRGWRWGHLSAKLGRRLCDVSRMWGCAGQPSSCCFWDTAVTNINFHDVEVLPSLSYSQGCVTSEQGA